MDDGLVARATLPLSSVGCLEWCSSTGLVAVSNCEPGQSKVLVIDANCLEEHCELQPQLASAKDTVQAISWSPTYSRHALLTATQEGGLTVWTNVPQEPTTTQSAPTINQWYGRVLQARLGENEPQDSNNSGMVDEFMKSILMDPTAPNSQSSEPDVPLPPRTLVTATWLSCPPTRHWSSSGIVATMPVTCLDELFLARGSTAAQSAQSRHWVRPSLLVAAVLDSRGSLSFWWATLGRHPSQLQWQHSQQVNLFEGNSSVSKHRVHITAASICAGRNGGVLAAVTIHSEPHKLYICNIHGNPCVSTQSTVPEQFKLRSRVVACIDIRKSTQPANHPNLVVSGFQIVATAQSHRLAVITTNDSRIKKSNTSTPQQGFQSTQILLFEDQPSTTGVGTTNWPSTATRATSLDGTAAAKSLSMSSDNSKVSVIAGDILHVLSTEDLTVIDQHQVSVPATQTDANNSLDMSPATAFTSFSPLNCCVCSITDMNRSVNDARLSTSLIQVWISMDLALGLPSSSLYGKAKGSAAASQQLLAAQQQAVVNPLQPLPDQAAESHARLTAARLVLAMLAHLPLYCLAQRCVAVSKGVLGWASTARALALLDEMIQNEDSHPRPTYSIMADRVKIAILRHMPGLVPACVLSDLVSRSLMSLLHQVFSSAAMATQDSNGTKTLSATDAAAIKPWLSWYGSFIQLMLSSLRAWSTAHANLTSSSTAQTTQTTPGTTGIIVSPDAGVLQAAAKISEKEGPGAAWAYIQGVQEACGPLSPEETAAAVPCVRLLLDRRFLGHMRYCLLCWPTIRSRANAGGANNETAEEAQARHQLAVHMKQLCSEIDVFLTAKAEPAGGGNNPQQQQALPQLTHEEVIKAQRTLFPGKVAVHVGRSTLTSTWTQVQALLSSPGVLTAPILTPRQLVAKARELGLLLAPTATTALAGSCHTASPEEIINSWYAYRGPSTPHHQLQANALPSSITTNTGNDGMGVGAATTVKKEGHVTGQDNSSWGQLQADMQSFAIEKRLLQELEDMGYTRKRRRWYTQRAVSLLAAQPDSRFMDLKRRSGVAAGCLQEAIPALDALAGVRLLPSSVSWTFEAVDGSFVTAQLDDAVLQSPAQQSILQQIRRAWIAASPVTCASWKRVRLTTNEEAENKLPQW